ncbi:hypothetical protein [Tautonia sociabilis]|uniref:Uncharacterized protein n=1 Tax=Tautonia sociabilis TaxID=2080755 RepID=A0A432MEH3_9BACT|nr:hypothetical protein [Tautonia sociabilis]RUL83893.1 hypothetical protein TsocGM_21445 [Tautonia sociabilis]
MNTPRQKAIHGGLAIVGLGFVLMAFPLAAEAQQGWGGSYVSPPAAVPMPVSPWQTYAPGSSWSGPAYATTGPAVAAMPAQPVTVPGAGWSGYNPAASWTGYAPVQAWSGYTPGYISVPRPSANRPVGRLLGWGWTQGGSYREPGTGRRIPMLKPWIPGAAGS